MPEPPGRPLTAADVNACEAIFRSTTKFTGTRRTFTFDEASRVLSYTLDNLKVMAPGSGALKAALLTNDACLGDNMKGIAQQDTYHFNGMHAAYELE